MKTPEEKEAYKQGVVDALETYMDKQRHVTGIMAELSQVLQEGTAEHFIDWHNSKATAANRISKDWLKQYKKECGNGQN